MTRLKYERRQRGHSQHHLAKQAGLTQPALSMIERGVLVPTQRQLDCLAALYSIPSADLLKDVVVVQA